MLAAGAASPAWAADLDGRAYAVPWALPFAGMLLSIALFPLFAPNVWHHHHGKISMAWAAAFVAPLAAKIGIGATAAALVHMLLGEYLPFLILLAALYTVSGGILIAGNLRGSPAVNTSMLAIGAVLASFMGTTGASMLLIRPLIRANDHRRHTVHIYVFFIFIVSNIGGALTPLGDPPLFLGFLQGVDFFWTFTHLLAPTAFSIALLLGVFFAIDSYWHAREDAGPQDPTPPTRGITLEGRINLLLLLVITMLVLMSGAWKPGIAFDLFGVRVEWQNLLRDLGLIAVTWASMALTPRIVRHSNQFGWGPIAEVAKLFLGIFITMLPVLAMLRAGEQGAFAAVIQAVTGRDGQPLPWAYFWATGLLSSFLDNAPTYLVFFNLAGADAATLMGPLASTLAAISAGAVYMGANSYIGNAPNFMVKAIVEERGIRMPSFFGYMAWSCGLLLPLFMLVTWLWMR